MPIYEVDSGLGCSDNLTIFEEQCTRGFLTDMEDLTLVCSYSMCLGLVKFFQ